MSTTETATVQNRLAKPAFPGIDFISGGPAIAGTRITVYAVLEYAKAGWHRDWIAGLFRLGSRKVQAALDYVDAHRAEVEAEFEKIMARHRNFKYSPEVQAKVDASRGAARRRLEEIRQQRAQDKDHAENHGGS